MITDTDNLSMCNFTKYNIFQKYNKLVKNVYWAKNIVTMFLQKCQHIRIKFVVFLQKNCAIRLKAHKKAVTGKG
ncbi:hypothetical protein SPSPH_038600 [Sporomusa sphaeroides DSM 2875]|uniref:Uncharacterized protein n=1 Tax=Sporomusa sphaeroides DSM 2875 TaxID=1337886 RepID=A0ABP2CBK3_9FIRM|nr:hypothetical protein SPSPH_41710 [Sporomusa sphaeroides DSM 2875]CVK21615.1 hypothetical protein SSPH_04307 [Sporomusa sphaeroides DSM 2875]